MRALGVREFGGTDALEVLDLPVPTAGPGEVRIRVHGATVNPTDTAFITGAYPGQRDTPGPHVPGTDAAGVVSQVGDGAPFAVGDRVMAVVVPMGPHGGAYADELVVPAEQVTRAPEGVDLHAASTLLMNALTARLVLEALALPAGATLAITGAAGAFGGYLVQLAKADGLRVVADASATDEQLVRDLGADEVVRRGDDVAARVRELHPDGVDALADGSVQGELVLGAVRDGGRVVSVRGWSGSQERGIEVVPVLVFDDAGRTDLLDELRGQVERGVLTLRVAQVLPAEQAADAHRLLAKGGVRGRIVLDFS